MRIDEDGAAPQQRDPGAGKQIRVHAVQALDLAILVGEQSAPIERGSRCLPAVAGGMADVLAIVRRIGKDLFRNAADIDAGAPEVAFLGNGNAHPEARGVTARAHPARTGADGEKVVIILRHGLGPPGALIAPFALDDDRADIRDRSHSRGVPLSALRFFRMHGNVKRHAWQPSSAWFCYPSGS